VLLKVSGASQKAVLQSLPLDSLVRHIYVLAIVLGS
jgi:hypothetical protein